MTRKDFVLIAETIRKAVPLNYAGDSITRRQIAEAFADALSGTNVNFDRERFLSACED